MLNLASEATFDGDEAMTTPGRPSQRKGVELSASYKPFLWLRLDGDFSGHPCTLCRRRQRHW